MIALLTLTLDDPNSVKLQVKQITLTQKQLRAEDVLPGFVLDLKDIL